MESNDKLMDNENVEGRFVMELVSVKCTRGHSTAVVFSAQGRDIPFYCPICGEEMTYLRNFVSHMGGSIDGEPLIFGLIYDHLSDASENDVSPDSHEAPPYLS